MLLITATRLFRSLPHFIASCSSSKFPIYNPPSLIKIPFLGGSTLTPLQAIHSPSGVFRISFFWADNQNLVTSSHGARNASSSPLPVVRERGRGLSFFLVRCLQRQRHPSRLEVPTDKSLELRSIVVADCRRPKNADC